MANIDPTNMALDAGVSAGEWIKSDTLEVTAVSSGYIYVTVQGYVEDCHQDGKSTLVELALYSDSGAERYSYHRAPLRARSWAPENEVTMTPFSISERYYANEGQHHRFYLMARKSERYECRTGQTRVGNQAALKGLKMRAMAIDEPS